MRKISLLFFILISVTALAQTDGLVAWYPFNGNANDESANGNNGTVLGPLLTTDRYGNSNSAYNFNGVNDMIFIRAVANSLQLNAFTDNYSVNLWVKSPNPNISTWTSRIIEDDDLSSIGYPFSFQVNNPTNITSGVITDFVNTPLATMPNVFNNTWHMMTFVVNHITDSIYAYIDTTLSDVKENTLTTGSASDTIAIGNRYFGSSRAYSGIIDDVRIFNRVLTHGEILNLYYGGCQYTFISQPQNQFLNVADNAQFSVSTTDTIATYQWQQDAGTGFVNLTNAGPYSGVFTDTLTISNIILSMNNYYYRCIVRHTNVCNDDTSFSATLTINTGINEYNIIFINIFPNPSTDKLSVTGFSGKGEINIYNVVGEEVLTRALTPNPSPSGEGSASIEVSELPAGIYFVKVFAGEKMVVRKVVKM